MIHQNFQENVLTTQKLGNRIEIMLAIILFHVHEWWLCGTFFSYPGRVGDVFRIKFPCGLSVEAFLPTRPTRPPPGAPLAFRLRLPARRSEIGSQSGNQATAFLRSLVKSK